MVACPNKVNLMPTMFSCYLAGHCIDDPNQTVYVLAGVHDLTSQDYEVLNVSEIIRVILRLCPLLNQLIIFRYVPDFTFY